MLNLFSHLEIHPKKRSVLVTSSHRVGIQCVALSNDIRFFSMSVNAKKNGATNKRNTCLNECNKYLFSLMLLVRLVVVVAAAIFSIRLFGVAEKKPCTYCVLMRAFPNGCTHVRDVSMSLSTIDRITKWNRNGRKMTFDLVDVRTRVNSFPIESNTYSRRQFVVIKFDGFALECRKIIANVTIVTNKISES